MKIIIKGKQYKVDENLQKYILERFHKYESMVQEPAIIEITLSDTLGPKRGLDKVVCITATLPDIKNPIHIEEATSEFKGTIDLIQERLEQQLRKYKDKVKIGSRFPKKYLDAKLQEEKEKEI
ncbi:ribosomal subunit interface protein [Candidatus Berkelbacteria bacterium RBG_13_40_8]|uniref:Ribosomal subunit interface protein n=1 Tax=Candidatus Berkelbacteria bacterium RBG_13_40_8 TaxID=1797467 RepID=A0A1F5DPC2_9BACT|nr:MAG: ribosomal subunit interface protein [Candidatus Berkelbacteria bacterium RBG_13_40_8]